MDEWNGMSLGNAVFDILAITIMVPAIFLLPILVGIAFWQNVSQLAGIIVTITTYTLILNIPWIVEELIGLKANNIFVAAFFNLGIIIAWYWGLYKIYYSSKKNDP